MHWLHRAGACASGQGLSVEFVAQTRLKAFVRAPCASGLGGKNVDHQCHIGLLLCCATRVNPLAHWPNRAGACASGQSLSVEFVAQTRLKAFVRAPCASGLGGKNVDHQCHIGLLLCCATRVNPLAHWPNRAGACASGQSLSVEFVAQTRLKAFVRAPCASGLGGKNVYHQCHKG